MSDLLFEEERRLLAYPFAQSEEFEGAGIAPARRAEHGGERDVGLPCDTPRRVAAMDAARVEEQGEHLEVDMAGVECRRDKTHFRAPVNGWPAPAWEAA